MTHVATSPAETGREPEREPDAVAATARIRLIIGFALLFCAGVFGIYLKYNPQPTVLDRIAYDIFPSEYQIHSLTYVTDLGRPRVLVPGLVVCFVMTLFWDRRRAITCAIAPAAAIAITEYIGKPLVHRMFGGSLSYPSGHMTSLASLVTMVMLAVPPRLRRLAVVLGILVEAAMGATLLLLRWHYLTDVMAGTAVAVGTILIIDTVVHLNFWNSSEVP